MNEADPIPEQPPACPSEASTPPHPLVPVETPAASIAQPELPLEAPPPPLESTPAAAGAPSAPQTPARHPFIFHGQTQDYFRIWIVNTLLTLLTAGVFLAWAKVRKRRYLRGSVELMGHRFDYRAEPWRLLIGHVVMLGLFLAYSVFGTVYPAIRYGVIVLGVLLLPWIVVRSISFNAHNTVYRGLRFRFNPSLSAALSVYLLEPLLIVVTLGLYYPAWERSKKRYVISNHRFGDAYFRFEGRTGPFYGALFFGGAIIFAALLASSMVLTVLVRGKGAQLDLWDMAPFFVVYAFGFFLSRQYIFARLFNHVWNHTELDQHRFRAELRPTTWLGLQIVNLFAILGTLGLLYPWAVIRAQRYLASSLSFEPHGAIDTIQRIGSSHGSATGDTAAEFVGLDFGL